jgi:hypothetical protein
MVVHPLFLETNKLLFSHSQTRVPSRLTDTKVYSSGLVVLSYTLA